MNKNNLLIIAAIVLMAAIGCEVAIYLGYDLYHSENGIFLRHKVYIATYDNMPENKLRQSVENGNAEAMAILCGKLLEKNRGTECKEVFELAQKSADINCPMGKNALGYLYEIGIAFPKTNKRHLICIKRLRTKMTLWPNIIWEYAI